MASAQATGDKAGAPTPSTLPVLSSPSWWHLLHACVEALRDRRGGDAFEPQDVSPLVTEEEAAALRAHLAVPAGASLQLFTLLASDAGVAAAFARQCGGRTALLGTLPLRLSPTCVAVDLARRDETGTCRLHLFATIHSRPVVVAEVTVALRASLVALALRGDAGQAGAPKGPAPVETA